MSTTRTSAQVRTGTGTRNPVRASAAATGGQARSIRDAGLRTWRAPSPPAPAPAVPYRSTVWAGRAAFTERELEVLECQSLGKTNPAIARALHMSTYTVMSHLCRMYTKAEAANGAALVAVGFRRGVLRPRPLPADREPVRIKANILELLPLVAAGYSNAQIAAALFLSVDTIKSQMKQLRGELQACSRAHLVRVAVEYGLLVLGPNGAHILVGGTP